VKGVTIFASLVAGALGVTALLATVLQTHALAGHAIDAGYAPGTDATTDHWCWRIDQKVRVPKAKPTEPEIFSGDA
jgi:hypothetical protein